MNKEFGEGFDVGDCDWLLSNITVFRFLDEVAGLSFWIQFNNPRATKEHYVPVLPHEK